jgi:hypothetical protein
MSKPQRPTSGGPKPKPQSTPTPTKPVDPRIGAQPRSILEGYDPRLQASPRYEKKAEPDIETK